MRRLVMSVLCLILFGHAVGTAQTLSDAEADAIVAAQAQARVDRQQARLAELEQAEVLSEGRGVLPNGQEVIVREVRPPAEEPIQPEVANAVQESTPSPEQIAHGKLEPQSRQRPLCFRLQSMTMKSPV